MIDLSSISSMHDICSILLLLRGTNCYGFLTFVLRAHGKMDGEQGVQTYLLPIFGASLMFAVLLREDLLAFTFFRPLAAKHRCSGCQNPHGVAMEKKSELLTVSMSLTMRTSLAVLLLFKETIF